MATTLAMRMSKWSLDLASRLVKAQVHLHSADVLKPDMAVIFTANHFTRLETMLLPYIIHKHTGLEPWSLASADLFLGRIGQYLHAAGAVSTKDPDRDKIIIHSLLRGDHPWILFPEGAMIKDKQCLARNGTFEIYDGIQRRPPHTGAAALALRTAYYRAKIRCLQEQNDTETLRRGLDLFGLESVEEVVARKTVIIPVNITYYPIRVRDNIFLRAARMMSKDLSQRALDELTVEGTVLSEKTDIDISFGEPIHIDNEIARPEYSGLLACDMQEIKALEANPRTEFQSLAQEITRRYMSAIYEMTPINMDHIFAQLVRRQPEGRRFHTRDYRERLYLSARHILNSGKPVHHALVGQMGTLLDDEPHAALTDFLEMAVEQGFLAPSDRGYVKLPRRIYPINEYHAMPRQATPVVIANEAETAHTATRVVRHIARAPSFLTKGALRNQLVREDLRDFEEDYARFYDPVLCKPPQVGRPFLLRPWRIIGGVVLAHGYMAAPLEVRMLAEHLYRQGFAVYGVRLKGHGTAPHDLAQREWQEWYASFNRGYAILRTLTDNIVLGGFSTGGCLALLGAARKQSEVKAVFSICAPLYVRNYSIRLVPSIISLNTLLKRFGQSQYAWEYVENDPENKHINYTRNPLTGVRQLTTVMNHTDEALPSVTAPTLVIQASKDTTVDPVSGPLIFDKLGTKDKQLVLFERDRHGIINGKGSTEVFVQVEQFLSRTLQQVRSHRYWLYGRRLGALFSTRPSPFEQARHERKVPASKQDTTSQIRDVTKTN